MPRSPRAALHRSAAALARAQKIFPPTVVRQLEEIEQNLGGRAEVVGMLVLAPLTPDLRYILGLLGDPQHIRTSLAEICALGNVLPGELLKHLAQAALLKGKVQASQKIGDGIAAVAEDVMRRAAPYEDACSTCAGIGSLTPDPTPAIPNPSPEPCETCHGTGRLLYRPDLERQRLAIDMAQLLPKSGGIQIGLQQNNGVGSVGGVGGTLERLQALSDRVLYGDPDDAAPADDPADAAPADAARETVEDGEVVEGAAGAEGTSTRTSVHERSKESGG